MLKTITVTADDISHGVKMDCEHCPINKAIQRLLCNPYRSYTGPNYVTIYGDIDDAGETISLPPIAVEFIFSFDGESRMKPISFPLDIPDRFLKA